MAGHCWFGTPCSSFIWIARGHTRRSARRPLGNTQRRDVRAANLCAERCFWLVTLLIFRGVFFTIEQPLSSSLFKLSWWTAITADKTKIIDGWGIRRIFVWLGAFGHHVAKPTVLVGIHPWMHSLADSAGKPNLSGLGVIYRRLTLRKSGPRKGTWRVCGVKKALKRTQVYPRAFAAEVAKRVGDHFDRLQARAHRY